MSDGNDCTPACTSCGKTARLVAKGVCRNCYDRARRQGFASLRVANEKQLSAFERAVIRAAMEHRRARGENPCLLDLCARLPNMESEDVARAAFGAIRHGSASYRFAPIQARSVKTPTCSEATDTQNHSEIGQK